MDKSNHSNNQSKIKNVNFFDNSANNQCSKLLNWLFEKGSITTTQAREELDIMSPAARILTLKKAGYNIVKINDNWTSEHGINHRGVARYVLQKDDSKGDKDREVMQ